MKLIRTGYYSLLLLVVIGLFPSGSTNAQESLTLAVHPYLSATELVNRFAPLSGYLSKKIGQPVIVEISKDYQSHIERVGKNQVDIAYMGPAAYVKLVDQYEKKPLLARLEVDGRPTFQGIIFVASNSTIRNLSNLAGKRFAFGDPNSTMSHLVPRYMLWKAGVGLEKLANHAFLSNHNNVALGVLMDDFDAGAVKEEVFYQYQERGLRVLQKTTPISEHVFVASSKLSPELARKLRHALYGLKNDPEGQAIMQSIKKNITGMVAVDDRDYDNLREILHTLERQGVKQ